MSSNAESQNVEWKSTWRDEYLKWICGFANAGGGKICLGVDDNGVTVGLDNARKLLEDIPNKVRDALGLVVDINLLVDNDMEYIEIVVAASSNPINYKGEYHYRSGSTKQVLKGMALTDFLTAKTGYTWDDMVVDSVDIKNLDADSFELFRAYALMNGRMDERDLNIANDILLENLGLIKQGKLTRAGVLLFHKNPEKIVKGAYIKIGYFETDSNLVYQDEVHGSLLKQAETTLDLLYTKYFKGLIEYKGVTRIERFPYPRGALREALFNAIVHKNYAPQIPIQISVYEDKMYIANDSVFPMGWTVETLLEKHRSKPYNPNIANGFFRAGLVETWGRGIEKICAECQSYGTKIPEWTLFPEDVSVKFYAKTVDETSEQANKRTSRKRVTIITIIFWYICLMCKWQRQKRFHLF